MSSKCVLGVLQAKCLDLVKVPVLAHLTVWANAPFKQEKRNISYALGRFYWLDTREGEGTSFL